MRGHSGQQDQVDVCVAGGGTAGCVAARRLVELGHTTLLLDRGEPQAPRTESLAPTIASLLQPLGLQRALDHATFARERRALLRWRAGTTEIKRSAPPVLLVER